jgi:hypothetical protein
VADKPKVSNKRKAAPSVAAVEAASDAAAAFAAETASTAKPTTKAKANTEVVPLPLAKAKAARKQPAKPPAKAKVTAKAAAKAVPKAVPMKAMKATAKAGAKALPVHKDDGLAVKVDVKHILLRAEAISCDREAFGCRAYSYAGTQVKGKDPAIVNATRKQARMVAVNFWDMCNK